MSDLPKIASEEAENIDASVFKTGGVKTQAQLLALHSHLVGNGVEDGAIDLEEEEAQDEEENDQSNSLKRILDGLWDVVTSALIASDSPYRTMSDPGSKYYYCFQAATPQEQQALIKAHEDAIQAEKAVDQSSQGSTDGKPAPETVLDERLAKTDEALAGTQIVIDHGKPEDVKKATADSKTLREKREYDRETQRQIRLATTKEEKLEILKHRSPDLFARLEKKAAEELERRNGTQNGVNQTGSAVITSSAPVEPLVAKPATSVIVKPVEDFKAAAGQVITAPAVIPSVAQDAGNYFNENRELLDISVTDNLDDPNNKYNLSLWNVLDKKPELIKKYDDATEKQEAACDALEKTPTADNFLAYRQSILDRKLTVNDVISLDYSAQGKTDEYTQAQTDRAKLVEDQKKLADLKIQMEGKSDAEKADLLRAAFPPNTKTGENLGMYDKYLADKKESPAATAGGNETDPDCCGDEDFFDNWILDGNWYDDGTSCVMGAPPGADIKDPGLKLSQNFTALANGQPVSSDQPTQIAPTSPLKTPSVVA